MRANVGPTASFVSMPAAFPGADEAIRHAPKFEVQTVASTDSDHPLGIEHVLYTHHMLLDLEEVDIKNFRPEALMRDCELLMNAAREHPEELRSILGAYQAGRPDEEILTASRKVRELGLDEASVAERGGNFILAAIVVGAVLLSGCQATCHGKVKKDPKHP